MHDHAGPGRLTETLELSLTASGSCDSAIFSEVLHKPKLLGDDNGPSYRSASELAEWIDANGMSHVRGAPNFIRKPRGKIDAAPSAISFNSSQDNRILLENYFLPGEISINARSKPSSTICNHQRHHEESLGNVTP